MYHIKKDNARNLFYKKLKIFLEIKNICVIFKTMRQGKKERKQKTKKQAKKSLIINNGIYATSSIYSANILGVSLFGGNDSKYFYIMNNSENKIINRLDNHLKVC